ncbi:MAG: carbon-nitrogen hydrolase family protein [Pontixanthobacter sp.]
MTRIALLQMNAGIEPERNTRAIIDAIVEAKAGGAAMLFTPEMSALLDRDRDRADRHIIAEHENATLDKTRNACAQHGLWCALGSIAVRHESGRYANRSLVVDDTGAIKARYDKIHMFDVDLANGESWRESKAYRAGKNVVTTHTPIGRLGLTVCYDIRFPALFEALGQQKCDAIAIPAAFTVPTGRDHWHVLQRARAIEASAYCIGAAQVGHHGDGRETFGHSLVIDPWGTVLLDMEKRTGLSFAEIDRNRVEDVRRQLPSLANRKPIAAGTGA